MKNFAYIIILASLATAINGKAVPKALAVLTKGLHRECASETKVPEAVITKGQNGEFSDQPEFKCYLKCLLAKLDLISESSEVDYDGMIRMLSPDIKETGTKMINDCRGTTGMDSCDTAYNLNTCLYNSNPVEYFLV
ncbi:B2 protein-like [Neodiprion pinetum]|uniref:Uncharacterized protein LOC107227916 n=1 Tax=Neodiprion lecontei TaxID=441921 RepID=A0A6J0CF66_NEOLC|nr:uncharacterized protein LOC107227916 [Neodiprion lecontei]XP_046470753.1 uncharacterized protein LOC124213438 [Neodiprion pinetum]XP_046608422.1 uncharacterized protein LOC124299321 [Neodiprion virginianus]